MNINHCSRHTDIYMQQRIFVFLVSNTVAAQKLVEFIFGQWLLNTLCNIYQMTWYKSYGSSRSITCGKR